MKSILKQGIIISTGVAALSTGFIESAIAMNLANGTTVINGTTRGTVTDSRTGLEWLDLDVTRYLSPDDALAMFPGYSWANIEQMNGLLTSFFSDYSPQPSPPFSVTNVFSTGQFSAVTLTQVDAFIDLFGVTNAGSSHIAPFAFGFYDDGDLISLQQDFLGFSKFPCTINCTPFVVRTGNSPTPGLQIGVFLVRPTVSVPTPALLPGLIGMGAAALRKRKQEAEAES